MADVTIDDTLRDTYAAIMSRGEGGDFEAGSESSGNETANEETVEAEQGAQMGSETAAGTETSTETQEAAGEESGEQQTQETPKFQPKWKKAALAEWEKLPPAVRAEVERRESDFHKGIEQYKTGAAAAQDWERAVQPYLATINGFGVTPQVAVQALMAKDHELRYSPMPQKVQSLLALASNYGMDLNTLAAGIQQIAGEQVWQQQNPVDPRLQQLQGQVHQLTQQLTNTQHQRVAQETSSIDSEIAAFATNPDHEHFGVLQKDMAVLLQAGLAKNLDDAYEMAMRQNPQTYQVWLAQQQQEWDAQRKAKVAKAKQAGANNVRPNGRATGPRAPANETMDQTLERVAREVGLTN